jgi:hypothetical protein
LDGVVGVPGEEVGGGEVAAADEVEEIAGDEGGEEFGMAGGGDHSLVKIRYVSWPVNLHFLILFGLSWQGGGADTKWRPVVPREAARRGCISNAVTSMFARWEQPNSTAGAAPRR